jgi:hypothetical protein
MKKYIAVLAAASALAAALVIPAGASANPSTNSPVFQKSGCNSVENIHNDALRFSTNNTDAIAIPGAVSAPEGSSAAAAAAYSQCKGYDQGIVHPPGYTD